MTERLGLDIVMFLQGKGVIKVLLILFDWFVLKKKAALLLKLNEVLVF